MELPRGVSVRPTAARVRGAIFDRLQAEVAGCAVLDLFAGSGALSFEAMSRGAARATLVESDRRLVRFLGAQVESLGLGHVTSVVEGDACAFVRDGPTAAREPGFDLVLIDPPYDRPELHEQVARALVAKGWLRPGAVVVCERERVRGVLRPTTWPDALELEARRTHGQTVLEFLRAAPRAR
jgi:16S rRNA (guanine966-N2)-methyltransferase